MDLQVVHSFSLAFHHPANILQIRHFHVWGSLAATSGEKDRSEHPVHVHVQVSTEVCLQALSSLQDMMLTSQCTTRCLRGSAHVKDQLAQGSSTVRRVSRHNHVRVYAFNDAETSRRSLLISGVTAAGLVSMPGGL